ncbi:MAG: flippase-like domain-containing protein [Clostridia bacterium]|nr:flippase-like domain-containing protein [Clostridia bacterium]
MNKKKIFWIVISILISGLSIWAVIAQSASFSLEEFKTFIVESDKRWVVGAALCMFGYIGFEGVAVRRIAAAIGYKRSRIQGTVYGAADVYFSAITPSASGGQPASAYFMLQDDIPGTAVTVTLLVNLIMYTLALLFLGFICSVFRFEIVLKMSTLSKVLIVVGSVVLIALAVAFFLLLKKAEVFYKICNGFLRFFERIHILSHHRCEKLCAKLNNTMAEYKECAETIYGKKKMLFDAFVLNVLQRLSQFFVAFFVFLAHDCGIKKAFDVLITQCFVSLGSNCIPIPGSIGVADYIMLDGYENIVGEELATYLELLARGISFYGCVVISAIIIIIAFVYNRIRRKKC